MGASQSSNTASALADIATDVTQQTSVSQSQVANVQQSINLGAGCDIELTDDFNANYAANITQKSNQVVNTLQNSHVTNDIAQKLMQTASSTVGALGVGYADASNSASMTVNATTAIKDALSATTTQQQNNFQTFNCYDSTIRAKNLNISFMTDDSFDSKQLVTNTQIAKVANKISQTATQKATATVQGIAGLLILFIILIIGGVLIFGKFVTSTGGKILSMCCMLVPIAIIFSVLYIFNCPPFFVKPNICSQGVSGPMGGCSDDKYCVDKKTNSKKITTETYTQTSTCPIRYQFPLITSVEDQSIVLLPMLISTYAINDPSNPNKNPALVNGGYNHYTWNQLYDKTNLGKIIDPVENNWYTYKDVFGIWIDGRNPTTTGTGLNSNAKFVPIAYVNNRYANSGSGTSGTSGTSVISDTSDKYAKYQRIPNPLTLMYDSTDDTSVNNFIMIPYLLYSNLEKKTIENEDKNRCLGWTPKTITGVPNQTGYGVNSDFYKCGQQKNPRKDYPDPGPIVPACPPTDSDSDLKGINPGPQKCKCSQFLKDNDKGYALLSPMICTITIDDNDKKLYELAEYSCKIGSDSCTKNNCPNASGSYENCCNSSADGTINIKPDGSFDEWVIKSSNETFNKTDSVDTIKSKIKSKLKFSSGTDSVVINNAGNELEPKYDTVNNNPLCFANYNEKEWGEWLNATDVYPDSGTSLVDFGKQLANPDDVKIIRSMFARYWALNTINETSEIDVSYTLNQSITIPEKSYSDFVGIDSSKNYMLGKGQLRKTGTDDYKPINNDTNGVVYYKPVNILSKDYITDHLQKGIKTNIEGSFRSYFGVCKDNKYIASNISSIIIYIILGILGITFIVYLVKGGGSSNKNSVLSNVAKDVATTEGL